MKSAILFLVNNYTTQPKLSDIAEHVNMSSFHFQRMFQEWVGVTPKQFVRYLSVEHAKKMLKETRATLFDTTHELGFSGTSRLHDLFVSIEGMTPGEYKNGGENLSINYSFADTPFGNIIIASTNKGICYMTFADKGQEEALDRLKSTYPKAEYKHFLDEKQQNALFVFTQDWGKLQEVKLHLKGTEFQLKIWETLLKVPSGGLTTYSDLALKAGHERAQRAVGTALGNNPVVLLIPCHRVIQASGIIGNYRYGEDRKNAIIGWEAAKQELITD
ncbi:methylated-DNA--[protein]-cysteine S-methyltransferase [Dysgonomonas sp. 216]|uniref:methylated-DNA--[protein]-cysteine S-methyltransferase n=1 Tax=Dysgonomonas sp. 216 TaxID=2302934 RepID=UPI0013CFF012|nr:methylated-DNA--[protein]-cysteine S-methyltransferase [Dysgonomonas sp. 216]NDW19312.1 methylated-DNA--[protein]-cysteine S-methyltransferase [Dysgonomonas sp. 216]